MELLLCKLSMHWAQHPVLEGAWILLGAWLTWGQNQVMEANSQDHSSSSSLSLRIC